MNEQVEYCPLCGQELYPIDGRHYCYNKDCPCHQREIPFKFMRKDATKDKAST